MPADPQVWTPETADGKMKHTFSGLRKSFANRSIHYIIEDKFEDFRAQLISRPEGKSNSPWTAPLATYAHNGLVAIQRAVQDVTHDAAYKTLPPLAERNKAEQDFVNRTKDKSTTLESLADDPKFAHSDEVLQPVDYRIASVHFDYTGQDNANMAQPTPARVKNTDLRALIIELDGLIVMMSQSPSADLPDMVNERDAAAWHAKLAQMFEIVRRAASKEEPHHPSGVTRAQLDDTFNADGAFDPAFNEGDGTAAEPTSGGASTPGT